MAKITVCGSGAGSITLNGLTPEEIEKCQGMVTSGNFWIRVVEGKLVAVPAIQALPDPYPDVDMFPFWRRRNPETNEVQTVFRSMVFDELTEHTSPSFHISSLCAYECTPEKYTENAQILESYGFYCLRSPRGNDGRYWETWYLPGIWAAKGRLEQAINRVPENTSLEKVRCALEYIKTTVLFGSLDVTVQRMAYVLEQE